MKRRMLKRVVLDFAYNVIKSCSETPNCAECERKESCTELIGAVGYMSEYVWKDVKYRKKCD